MMPAHELIKKNFSNRLAVTSKLIRNCMGQVIRQFKNSFLDKDIK